MSLNSTVNTTNNVKLSCTLTDASTVTKSICYLVVMVMGVIGNSVVLFKFAPLAKTGHSLEMLVMYLALFDLIASIVSPFSFLYRTLTCNQTWHFGLAGCKIISAIGRISVNISIGMVLIMAIDRCRAITRPMGPRFRKVHLHVAVMVTVVTSFVWETHTFIGYTIQNGQCEIWEAENPRYALPFIILTILRDLSFIVIFTSTSYLIYRALTRSARSVQAYADNTHADEKSHNTLHTVRMLMVMAVVFGCLVLPRDALQLAFYISWLPSWYDKNHQGIPIT